MANVGGTTAFCYQTVFGNLMPGALGNESCEGHVIWRSGCSSAGVKQQILVCTCNSFGMLCIPAHVHFSIRASE